MNKLILIIINFCIIAFHASAQNYTEMGSQAITNYSPKEYNAFGQNWAVAQASNGIMYFGNWAGLVEYDGARWRIYELPNKSVVLSLAIAENGRIFTGGINELGYFLPDYSGKLTFHSILEFLPEDKRDFSSIWQTFVYKGEVYFFSNNYIFIWNDLDQTFKIIQEENGFHTMFIVNGSFYVRVRGRGLELLEDGLLNPLSGGQKFADEKVFVMLPFPGEDDKILIVTRTMGIFKYDGYDFVPFKTEADKFIEDNLIYAYGTDLSDGNFLLGTLSGGAVIIDQNGKEVRKYNLENGIVNNNIYFTFQDKSGAIWLATDNGISRIDYSSPISYFDSRNNFTTIPFNIIRYKGIIYIAATTGIYYLDPKSSKFYKLENVDKQCWEFLEIDNSLLVGTSDGLFKIENKKLFPVNEKVKNDYLVNVLEQSKINPDRIYVGTDDGIYAKLKRGRDWIDEIKILNNMGQKNSIVEDDDGKVWVGTVASGIFRITFKQDERGNFQLTDPIVEHFDEANLLQKGQMSVGSINGTNYFFSLDSIYKFDESKKIFISDTSDKIISNFYKISASRSVIVFQHDDWDRLWIGPKSEMAMGTPQPDGSYSWISAPFNRFADEEIYNVYAETKDVVWFCTNTGIIKYDFSKQNFYNPDYTALVRNVKIGEDSTIYFGGKVDDPAIPEITFKNNSVKFRYSATSYEGKNTNQFKTFLDGFDEGWSQWSSETRKEYTNLPPGEYTFNIAALNILGIESSADSYSLEILPPWYRTWWAYSFYFLVLGLVIFATDRIQRRRLINKERERAENERKTQELEEARKLQLSMLPKDIPQLPNLDIAVYMQTATEVGGDYYDFSINDDGSLNVCLGDATGHGLKAGIIVSMMKSMFTSISNQKNIDEFLSISNNGIKNSKLDKMMIAFAMLNININKIRVANAGIPPIYIYRKNDNIVEEIKVNGMPLGAMKNSRYEIYENELTAGDTILMLSDGFPELQNENNEQYGYERLLQLFSEIGGLNSEQIVDKLKNVGSEWVKDKDPDDDVTFVVIKVK